MVTSPGERPTLGHFKRHRCPGIVVFCSGAHCSKSAAISFDTLGLPDDTPLDEVRRRKPFVCSRCGSRAFEVRPDWPGQRTR